MQGNKNMTTKVTGLNIIEELVNQEELNQKHKKDVEKDQIAQLVAQGIDKKTAKVIVKVFNEYGIA